MRGALEASRPQGARAVPGAGGRPESQRGAALLALVLALALGSGLVTIEWLEAAARSAHAARRTEAALAAAREALIGYAASYPDQHAGRHGPGYLPCPDTSGNGSPNTPCHAAVLGRLPWRRLGLHDPRDGAGERLWYAIDRRFRANGYKHRPLNGDTAADLVVNAQGGIAAVILAPGPALAFQDRSRDRFDPAQYLEGGNESPGDGTYASREATPSSSQDRFNDRVEAISRDELMAAAGHRALAAAREALEAYRAAAWNPGVLPWLAPWTGPAEGALPVPGVAAGRLPLARSASTFKTALRITGSVTGGVASASGTVPLSILGLTGQPLEVAVGECSRTQPWRVECTGESRTVPSPGQERVFRFDLRFSGDAAIAPPTPTDFRRRGVRGVDWAADSHIEVLDFAGGTQTGHGVVRFAPGPIRGTLAVDGIAHPVGADGEAPEWLLANEWHRFLAAAVAPAFTAGGAGDCAMPGRCLALARTGFDGPTDEREATAVVVLAGTELAHQQRGRPGPAEWFEGENANPANLRYEVKHASTTFNDQAAAIETPPGALTP